MPTPFIAVLLLAAAPLVYAAARSRLLSRRGAAWTIAAIVGAALIASFPRTGVDFLYVKRLDLLVAAAASIALAFLHVTMRSGGGAPGGPPRCGLRRRRVRGVRRVLAALAVLAAIGWLNFFSFHGEATWIHLHDVAHYYVGSRYFAEIGYGDLYTAMLRAEAETHEDRFRSREARDLATYDQVDIRVLLARSDEVKARFTPARWEDFKKDVEHFRGRLGPQYGAVLLDHGFNPTPVWARIGGALANLVPPGSPAGILTLTLIDPVLLIAAIGLAGWAFGLHASVLMVLHFCVIFGATFGWTGGAFMRQLWFFGVVACACFLKRGRPAAAGASLALAAALRIFPLFFLVPLAGKAIWTVASRRRRGGSDLPAAPARRWAAFLGGFAGGLALLAASTATLPAGLDHWRDFRRNLATHVETISPNIVGLTDALAWRSGGGRVTQEEFRGLKLRRQRIYTAQIVLVFLPLLAASLWLSRRFTDWGCLVLALPLLWAGLSLASYYHVFLVLLVLAYRRRPRDLSLVFAAEAVAYALMLFEDREALLYVYRGIGLGVLYALLFMDPVRREARRILDAERA